MTANLCLQGRSRQRSTRLLWKSHLILNSMNVCAYYRNKQRPTDSRVSCWIRVGIYSLSRCMSIIRIGLHVFLSVPLSYITHIIYFLLHRCIGTTELVYPVAPGTERQRYITADYHDITAPVAKHVLNSYFFYINSHILYMIQVDQRYMPKSYISYGTWNIDIMRWC